MAFQKHFGAQHGRNARGVRNALCARLFVGILVLAVVPDVVGALLAILDALDAATDGGLAGIVFTQITGIGQYGFQEFEWNHVDAFVLDGFDARHADVLDHPQVGQVFIAKGHPETGAFERGVVFDQRLQFFVVNHVRTLGAYVGVVDVLPDLVWLGVHPLAIFPVAAFLGYLTDVDFGVEVGGKSLAITARIGVDDVEVMDLIEEMLGGVGGEYARNARVKTTA